MGNGHPGWNEAPPVIVLSDVRFAYPGSRGPVFEHLSFFIPAGATVAVVGRSGAGKSTLLALLIGLIEPSHGKITLGGVKPGEWARLSDYRLGYVGTEPLLMAGTIEENLRYGLRRRVPEEDLWTALEKVGLSARVEKLPGGLRSRLRERAPGLSTGEKQRLALARAMLASPRLLILDEPTANLDERSEAEIIASLAGLAGRCTTVIASHRSTLIRTCDSTMYLPSTMRGDSDPTPPSIQPMAIV